MASGGDEGRGKLRKGAGIRKQEVIRTYPNGGILAKGFREAKEIKVCIKTIRDNFRVGV